MKDRILGITDLLLGAANADSKTDDAEVVEVEALLAKLLETKELPAEVATRLNSFDAAKFDLAKVAADFVNDSAEDKRKLLELVAAVRDSDGEIDFAEDDYLRNLAEALKVPKSEYADLTLDIEVEELSENLASLRKGPPAPPS